MIAESSRLADAELVIFDWDGTLYQSIDLIESSIVAAGRDVGTEISPGVARSIIGLGLKAAQKQLFPGLTGSETEFFTNFHKAYRSHYEPREQGIPLYDGVRELIAQLYNRGKVIAVATAKSRAGIDRCLESTGLKPFVAHSRTPEECRPKPDPQMIEEILFESKIPARRAVMVGDTTHDLQMGLNAGVSVIAITHGAHARDKLQSLNPDAVCDDIASLQRLIVSA